MSHKLPVSGTHVAAGTKAVAASGLAGALIGGAISAAKQIKDVKEKKISKEEAMVKTAKDAAGTGLATAAGVVTASMLGLGGIASLLVAVGAATGAKYLWDESTKAKKNKTEELTKAEGSK